MLGKKNEAKNGKRECKSMNVEIIKQKTVQSCLNQLVKSFFKNVN